jgi:hypothetical protein
MDVPPQSFWDSVQAWLLSGWAAAVAGRLTYHSRMVQKGNRAFWSRELVFELPIVIFTYLIGAGIADHFGWTGSTANGLIAGIAYLGPGGLQALAQWWARAPR